MDRGYVGGLAGAYAQGGARPVDFPGQLGAGLVQSANIPTVTEPMRSAIEKLERCLKTVAAIQSNIAGALPRPDAANQSGDYDTMLGRARHLNALADEVERGLNEIANHL